VIVSVGRLGDVTGHRRLLLAGIFLFTAASVVCGVAPSLWVLIAGRAAQGIGASVMMALTMAFISGMLNLSRNLGLITGASVMGAVFALASAAKDIKTAGSEAVATGMRTTFAFATILLVVALAIAFGASRRTERHRALAPEPKLEANK
jgi:MFS family permease